MLKSVVLQGGICEDLEDHVKRVSKIAIYWAVSLLVKAQLFELDLSAFGIEGKEVEVPVLLPVSEVDEQVAKVYKDLMNLSEGVVMTKGKKVISDLINQVLLV